MIPAVDGAEGTPEEGTDPEKEDLNIILDSTPEPRQRERKACMEAK